MAIRQDVATLGPGWNKTLHHYALAMRELDELPITQPTSWRFLAAIHGFDRGGWVSSGVIANTDSVPDALTQDDSFGNQCAHGSWYFLPWHRGYLHAFEAIVASKVKELTGEDWALPYWNYFDNENPNALEVPEVFLAETLPDKTPNPLSRYPRGSGFTRLPRPNARFNLDSMSENDFQIGITGTLGLGGGVDDSLIQFDGSAGDLELNPHNSVHGLVGGFMGNALYAGLDPLFWLHHCNIDRMWEAWMSAPGKTMVRDPRWLSGPVNRRFIMPSATVGQPAWTFKSQDTLRGGQLQPQYDDLSRGTGVVPGAATVARVSMGAPNQQIVETIGANTAVIAVAGAPVQTDVPMLPASAKSGIAAMGVTAPGQPVSRLYLSLESVRGAAPSPLIEVYVNLPDGSDPRSHPDRLAGSLTLFGLNVASNPSGTHAGNGLGYTLDITDLAKRLKDADDFDPTKLRVTVVPLEQISDASPITIQRVSVLARTGKVS